jgi:phage shock protein A
MTAPDLGLLQAMVQRVLDGQSALQEEVHELSYRMSTVEQQIANVAASEASHYASVSTRLDHITTRIERIKRRLDLVEPAAS